ncbi:MAG: rhamnogalacturonan acetylesterase [Chitinophagaceae bacterium]
MKCYYFLYILTLANLSFAQAQNTSSKFDFGEGPAPAGFNKVTPTNVYSPQAVYGFDYNSSVTAKKTGNKNKVEDDYITSTRPFYFSVKLPEGNYNVKVILGDANGVSVTTIKAECRRLMIEKAITKKGMFIEKEFTVHVKDSLIRGISAGKVKLKPRERVYLHWDDKLTLEFNNAEAKVCSVEIIPAGNVPVIFLAGNSTVVDQAEEPWAAWGQMFPAFMQPGKVCVANYAESGETLKAFKGENRLEKIWSLAKPGDYLFIEFAHNAQKQGSSHLDPFTTYKETLKEWITEARKRNITPVLVTSMNRRSFDSATGKIRNTLEDFPEAMRQTGKEEDVTVLDLNAMSKILYEAWGAEKSVKAFVHYPANTFPNQPKELKDDTHFNAYGAFELAKCIVQAISKSSLPLKRFINTEFRGFDPSNPDPVELFNLPASSFTAIAKPDGI